MYGNGKQRRWSLKGFTEQDSTVRVNGDSAYGISKPSAVATDPFILGDCGAEESKVGVKS